MFFSFYNTSLVLSISILSYQVVVVDAEAYTYDDEVMKKADAMGRPGLVEISAQGGQLYFHSGNNWCHHSLRAYHECYHGVEAEAGCCPPSRRRWRLW
jgi:hypothetical protein